MLLSNQVAVHRSNFGFISLCRFGQYLVNLSLFLFAEIGLAFAHRMVPLFS